jgi:hypothetical protein
VRLVHHEAGAEALAQIAQGRQRGHVALHGEDAVDHHQHPAPVLGGALQRVLEAVDAVVAEGP